jgi:hypothetical protein
MRAGRERPLNGPLFTALAWLTAPIAAEREKAVPSFSGAERSRRPEVLRCHPEARIGP